MRYFLALFLVANFISAAAAEPGNAPNELSDPKSNSEFLSGLSKRIEGAGYSNVHMIPQMFVVLANRSDGKPTTLIVDSKSLQAVEVEGALEFIGKATGTRPGTELPTQH
jgi:hypothetical protein